jgi:hypothetical protein
MVTEGWRWGKGVGMVTRGVGVGEDDVKQLRSLKVMPYLSFKGVGNLLIKMQQRVLWLAISTARPIIMYC